MEATAKRCHGPMSSERTLEMAEVESTDKVYCRPLSCRWPMMLRARYMAQTSASKLAVVVGALSVIFIQLQATEVGHGSCWF